MRQAAWCVVFACVVLYAGEVAAISGSDYQRLSATERAMYVAGAVEGWFAADAVLRANPSPVFSLTFGRIVKCVSGRLSTIEVRTIVDRYVTRASTDRTQQMSQLVSLALQGACRP
jgi:hypothetical protein